MTKNLNVVLQIRKNNHFLALAITVPKNQNLYHCFDGYNIHGQEVMVAHLADSWKQALEIEKTWNDGFVANGTAWAKEDYYV